MAKATYGTGIFLLQQAGAAPPAQTGGLLPVVAWELTEGRPSYALDGGVFSAGTVLTWLRDGLGAFQDPAESEALARSVPDTDGVRFLPALAGMGAPWWRADARAVVAGITASTTRAHIVRAALDALCFRVRDLVDALPVRPDVLRVDGGLTANGYLVQRQADVLGHARSRWPRCPRRRRSARRRLRASGRACSRSTTWRSWRRSGRRVQPG